jgi:hypothetical protein
MGRHRLGQELGEHILVRLERWTKRLTKWDTCNSFFVSMRTISRRDLGSTFVAHRPPYSGDGSMVGLLTGVGPGSERSTGPWSGDGSGLTTVSGTLAGFSGPGLGDIAGRMTTRGVGVASGEGDDVAWVECSDRLTR